MTISTPILMATIGSVTAIWPDSWPALADHLWQSTAFLVIAGLATLSLRKHAARTRYWLWLVASAKFLVPFSLLVAIGRNFGWSRPVAIAPSTFYYVIEEVGRPFARGTAAHVPVSVLPNLAQSIPAVLAAIWLCGFLAVVFMCGIRWRRVARCVKSATPVSHGREVDALRRAEKLAGVDAPIEMVISDSSLEPGIFGIAHPILVWPAGISKHLDDAHLESVLAHEVWHVRRRDNLAALFHMFVEALFWFHPLVWWVGARLLEERERACDEEVVELGRERQIYAESILKVCEFCLSSPLVCVSGVTGADLKKRMVYIMTDRIVRKLSFTRKLLLAVAGSLTIAMPVIFGVLHATPIAAQSSTANASGFAPGFESVSIKSSPATDPHATGPRRVFAQMIHQPDGVVAFGATLPMLVSAAYGVHHQQVSVPAGWMQTDSFSVEARLDKSTMDALQKLTPDQRILADQQVLQALLAERFKLQVHSETKNAAQYALVVADGGAKLQGAKADENYPNGFKAPDGAKAVGMVRFNLAKAGNAAGLEAQGANLSSLTGLLSDQLGRPVVDKTGLTGKYDFTLHWAAPANLGSEAADGAEPSADESAASSTSSNSSEPSIVEALRDQLGLELKPQNGPVTTVVIDHAEKPADE
jgi:bla regulator protein blaR1